MQGGGFCATRAAGEFESTGKQRVAWGRKGARGGGRVVSFGSACYPHLLLCHRVKDGIVVEG